jgi:phosphoesterase RecJ-like protein
LGLAHLLQQLGKSFTICSEDPVASKFRFFPLIELIKTPRHIQRKFQHVIVLDCGDRYRLGTSAQLLQQNAEMLNIDHHKTNDHFGTANLVDLDAAATCQIVFNLAAHMGVQVSRNMAVCLYTGLMTDTGGFRYSNTTVQVHQIAAELLGQGVAPYEIADRVMETITWSQVQLIRETLATLQRDESGELAWMAVSSSLLQKLGASDEDAEGLVSYARNVQGVEVGILFKEKGDGKVKVSLRSKYRVDVGELALAFGGGGHARAAGCTISGSLQSVIHDVVAKASEALKR